VLHGTDDNYLAKLQDYYADNTYCPLLDHHVAAWIQIQSAVAALVARLKLAQFLESTRKNALNQQTLFERPSSIAYGRLTHPAGDMRHDTVTIDEYLVRQPSSTVLVSVKGDSMIDSGIMEGDTVVVEKRNMANIGDMVIAIVDNEFTLKTLGKEKENSY